MNPAAPVMTIRMSVSGRLDGAVQAAQDGEPHDLEIERQRPVLDVVQVELDALFERRVAAPAVHLRPAGDAGLDLVPQHVLRDAVLELFDEERPLGPRADDGHVAAQHVPELRQLVEVEPAQPAADASSPADRRRAPRSARSRPRRPRASMRNL